MSKSSVEFSKQRILLIENNKMMRRLVRDMLLNFKVKQQNIVEVSTVEAALEHVYSDNFNLVILDFFLGDLDGGDFTRHVRTDPRCPNRKVPILLITASPNHEKVLKVLEAGVNEVLAKPIAPSALFYRMFAMLSRPLPFVISREYTGPSRSIQRLESLERLSGTSKTRREWRTVYRSKVTYTEQPNKTIRPDPLLL